MHSTRKVHTGFCTYVNPPLMPFHVCLQSRSSTLTVVVVGLKRNVSTLCIIKLTLLIAYVKICLCV